MSEGTWENGICSCFNDCSICLLSFFCPCVQLYRNANALPDGESGILFVLGYFGLFGLNRCYDHATLRGDIRDYKNIKGTYFGDFMYTCCCPSLSLAQESLEMKGDYMLRE